MQFLILAAHILAASSSEHNLQSAPRRTALLCCVCAAGLVGQESVEKATFTAKQRQYLSTRKCAVCVSESKDVVANGLLVSLHVSMCVAQLEGQLLIMVMYVGGAGNGIEGPKKKAFFRCVESETHGRNSDL